MGIEYSDGSIVEEEIERLLVEAPNLDSTCSISSTRYAEWPIRYHLSPERANLLRHFNFTGLSVLELGAGMGAVSRYLAEKAATLTVVEGTEQRFQALSERLRDLKNWSGQVANLMDVTFEEKFDVVVVVGALEYSELFVKPVNPEESPFEGFLQKAKSFLKPEGVLVLAIENQLGLKYFNGAPEDHTDHLYDGLSGYSLNKSPKTFSRKKLSQLFSKVGLNVTQEYFPFPDYKLPTCVLSQLFCVTEPTLAASLATHKIVDSSTKHWNERLGTLTIAEAGLLPDLANSFLFVATLSNDSLTLRKLLPPRDQLAWHYSMNRKVPTTTTFFRERDSLFVKKSQMGHFESSLVKWLSPTVEPIQRLKSVREILIRAGYFGSSESWLKVLTDYLRWALKHFATEVPGFLVGKSVDAIYTNAQEKLPSSDYHLFDLEWEYQERVPASWFILRNVLALHEDLSSFPKQFPNLENVYLKLCKELSIAPQLEKDIHLESVFQSEVTPEKDVTKFQGALTARFLGKISKGTIRVSEAESALFQSRIQRSLSRFPDFLSAMDRPSTRLFLTLDEKIRKSEAFREFYTSLKNTIRFLYRLWPARYEAQGHLLIRKWGALPKVGWSYLEIWGEGAPDLPHEVTLQLQAGEKKFLLPLRKKGKRFTRILRLHEPIESLSVIPQDEFILTSARTRNLVKLEVALRLVLPQLLSGFSWKNEWTRFKSYWNQGGYRGAVAYVLSLVQRGDIGTVESYSDWTEKYDTLSDRDRTQIQAQMENFSYAPKISILMPVYNTDPKWLELAVTSVERQLYKNWELCIADDASTSLETRQCLEELVKRDPRILVRHREKNGHIAEASNTALEMATGEFIAILDHDDEINEAALYHIVRELNRDPNLALLYSDEDKIDSQNRRFLPHFKTDWNPELFYCYNLITHFAVMKTELVRKVGGFRAGFEGSQDYDLFLRCIENIRPSQICHIPYVLYHWRVLDSSTSGNIAAKPYAKTAALKALNEHLERMNIKGFVEEGYNDCFRMRYALPAKVPKVSLIICTRDREDLLKTVIDGILKGTDYSDYEILIVNNQSSEPEALQYLGDLRKLPEVTILDYDHPFNFAAMNNLAAVQAKGEVLAFLNNDLKITDLNWLKEMVAFAVQPHIGAVGAKLLYPSGRLQHAGVILGIGGVAGHSHKGFGPHQRDFYARTHVSQCISAVTAACLVVRKKVFEEVGGFDAENLRVAFNDVDLCLKIRERGYSNVWTPYATLVHFESESRGSDQRPETFSRFQKEESFMKEKWGEKLKKDPYYSPNLTLQKENFDFAYPPRVGKPWKPEKRPTPPSSPF